VDDDNDVVNFMFVGDNGEIFVGTTTYLMYRRNSFGWSHSDEPKYVLRSGVFVPILVDVCTTSILDLSVVSSIAVMKVQENAEKNKKI
jgi:hypothetical protein